MRGVARLIDRLEGIDGAAAAEAITRAVDELTTCLDDVGTRVGMLELDREVSDEKLILVSLDERLARLEQQQAALIALLRRALGRAP